MIYMGNTRVGFNALTSLPAANPPPSDNLVKFRDYDGTVLYAYTPAKIASMEYLPPLPTRPGLTCQEWNWSLAQIKSYVATYGRCEVGATYTTDDGKTRIKITIRDPKYSNIPLVFQQTVANGVQVDWGDGSAAQTYSGTSAQTITHQYSPQSYPATYTVTFNVTSGTMKFPSYGNNLNIMGKSSSESADNTVGAWTSMIDSVRIGDGVTSIGNYVFNRCHSLASITIPNSVTSIGINAFNGCHSLASVTIPNSVTSISNGAFRNCYSLASVTIPNSVTSIGNEVFSTCQSLASITIPSTITRINNKTFYNCYALTSIAIPSSITSIVTNAFDHCYSLASITIPNSVTSIGSSAFLECCGIKTYDFRTATAVPQLSNVNAFGTTPSDKEIIVPDALYDTWKGATNWNSTTNNIVNCIVKASQSSLGPL